MIEIVKGLALSILEGVVTAYLTSGIMTKIDTKNKKKVIQKRLAVMQNELDNAFLHLFTGQGKTPIGDYKEKVAHSRSMLEELRDSLCNLYYFDAKELTTELAETIYQLEKSENILNSTNNYRAELIKYCCTEASDTNDSLYVKYDGKLFYSKAHYSLSQAIKKTASANISLKQMFQLLFSK